MEIPLADGQTVNGIIDAIFNDGGHLRVSGHIGDKRTGTFSVSLGKDLVGGTVQLRDSGTAFVVENDASGGPSLHEKPLGSVLCTPMPRPRNQAQRQEIPAPNQAPPIYDSRPNATAVVYLDFDGETVTDPSWNDGRTIVAPAARFSNAEIIEVCQRLTEDFWPFNVNVTTNLSRYKAAPVGRRMRCIITSNDAAAPGAGGVAYLYSFSEAGGGQFTANIPCWVFIDNDAPACAEACAHELGHTLGLSHDGRDFPNGDHEEYYEGQGSGAISWAPIMGVGYYVNVVQWSKGEYQYANNHEDDVAMISAPYNGIGYIADETPDTLEGAIPLTFNAGNIDQEGIITKASDIDFYSFSTTGGSVTINANGATPSPDLDILLQLLDDSGNVLASSNPLTGLNASITRTLSAGNYFIQIQGTGAKNPFVDGYSNYASIGKYALSGTVAGGTSSAKPIITSSGVIPALRNVAVNYQIEATGNPTSYGLTGPVPAWLNLNTSTGAISGTPTASGVFNLVMSATNASGTGTKNLVITVNVGAVSLGDALDAPNLVWLSGGDNSNEWIGEISPSYDGVDAIESGPIGDNQEVHVETDVNGPCTVSFHWRTDSELDGDILAFIADGTEKKHISGQTGWLAESFNFGPGSHHLRWEYRKNGSVSTGLDHGWVDTVSVVVLSAPFITSSLSATGEQDEDFLYQIEADNNPTGFGLSGSLPNGLDFDSNTGVISGIPSGPAYASVTISATNEAGTTQANLSISISPPIFDLGKALDNKKLSWTTVGSKLWLPQTAVSHDGVDAARSGPIFHGGSTELQTTVIGPTAVRFFWKVSSEQRFDVLEFLIDGVVQGSISGDVDWTEALFPIPNGLRKLSWRYRKDGSVSAGADAGWVDQVSIDHSALVLGSRVINGRINEPFRFRIAAVNTPTKFEADTLPPGLTLNSQTGIISGTPTTLGQFPVTLSVTNASGVEQTPVTIVINKTRTVADLIPSSTYTGLVRNASDQKLAGAISIHVSAGQTYTGLLRLDRYRYAFRGKLDPQVAKVHTLLAKGGPTVTLTVGIDSLADINKLKGDLQTTSATYIYETLGSLSTVPLPAIGNYTVLIEPDSIDAGLPGGVGSASLSLSKLGVVKAVGVLGDGSKFTMSGPLDLNHKFSAFTTPYRGGGFIGGPMNFDLQATTPSVDSDLEWTKLTDLRSILYPNGFEKAATLHGERYIKPALGTRVLTLTTGDVQLLRSDLDFNPRTQSVTLLDTNKFVITPAIPSFKISILPATGMLRGSFRAGALGPLKTFTGAIIPSQNRGAGVFSGTSQTGEVVLDSASVN